MPDHQQRIAVSFLLLLLGFPVPFAFPRDESKPAVGQARDSARPTHGFGEVRISPNGRYIAWTSGPAIFVKDWRQDASEPQQLTEGTDVVWSPDSRRLAFLCDTVSMGQQQLCLVEVTGGPTRMLTNLKGALADPKWSPDGGQLAFLFVENSPRRPGAMEPMEPFVGVIRPQSFEQRVAVVDLNSGQVRQVSPPDLYVYEYDWSPDGKSVVGTGAHGPADDNHYIAELYTINIGSGKATSILKPDMQMTAPRWSPDGKRIAFIGGLMAGFGGGNCGDVYVIPAGGGHAQNVTPQIKASVRGPNGLHWLSPNRLLLQEWIHGNTGLAEVDLTQGRVAPIWTGSAERGSFGDFSIARDGTTSALSLSSVARPPEVWAGPLGTWKQVTHANEGLRPAGIKVESLDWKSDGWLVQGWLYYPLNYDLHQRYPMVVDVHGGPTAAVTPGWGGDAFAAAGYFVLKPNYVGSAGEGEAFARGIVKDVGYADFRSIVAGVNKVLETLPVDKNRVGITGWSNGGYLAMWAVTQTNLFHAAAPGAGISDWVSYAGENDIARWALPYFGGHWPWDDPALYARSSPITFIKNVKTPTLILVGERDGECPAPQSIEFWGALRLLGVKSELVIYPGEGHDFYRSDDLHDVARRRMEFFNKYLK